MVAMSRWFYEVSWLSISTPLVLSVVSYPRALLEEFGGKREWLELPILKECCTDEDLEASSRITEFLSSLRLVVDECLSYLRNPLPSWQKGLNAANSVREYKPEVFQSRPTSLFWHWFP